MSWVRTFEDVLVGIALLNLTISVVIVRSESLTVPQKLAQVLIVWLIPPLGGCSSVCSCGRREGGHLPPGTDPFLTSQHATSKKRSITRHLLPGTQTTAPESTRR